MSFTRTFIVALLGLFWTLSGSSLFAQNVFEQNAWETLPVFHNGRVMPLHTFAQQTVREICGTTRPYIIRDDAVIDEFNQVVEILRKQSDTEQDDTSAGYRFLIRGSDFDGGFGRTYSIFDVEGETQQITTTLPSQGLDRVRVERLANRIRQLVPREGRYFTADEILFSWICEPEVWMYIPIFLVPEADYLDEIFDISFKNDVRTSQYRVSLYQLTKSQRYKQRCVDIRRRQELGQITRNPIRFDQITERLESQSQLFRELTFHPQRQRPDRMLSLLYQAAGMTGGQSSYSSAFEAWWHLLVVGDPGRRTTERTSYSEELVILHPTTQRWHEVADKLHLLMQVYNRTDANGNPVFPNTFAVERQYEFLIDLVDRNLAEAAALMETVYPGVSYLPAERKYEVNIELLLPKLGSPDNQQNQTAIRRTAISYYYSVKKLRNEIEVAYLALYDNGRSLRFLPLRSPLVFEMGSLQTHSDVQPWASAQMILGSGETFVKRFLDPQLDILSTGLLTLRKETKTDTTTGDAASEDAVSDEMNASEDSSPPDTVAEDKEVVPVVPEELRLNVPVDTEEQLNAEMWFQPFDMETGILSMSSEGQSTIIGAIRDSLRRMHLSYRSSGSGYGTSDFIVRVQRFQPEVRQAAVRIETYRKSLVDEQNPQMVEHLAKTAYPDIPKLLPEYRYDRLRPFFWMWFFALLAVLLNGAAYIAAMTRSKSAVARTISIHSVAKTGENEETELQDYTNSIEEWIFVGSVAMLILSILVAFVGGTMRAIITGWAPVTNMYETVVMMAFSTAILGVWYALHPLLHPALQLAWTYSKFPGIGTLLDWFAAIKAQKSVPSPRETEGEAAMREAAVEFGVPSGVTFGGHSVAMPGQTPEELEAHKRVKTTQRKMMGQCLLALPRLILTFATFYLIVLSANGTYATDHGFLAAVVNMFATSDVIDWLTVVASVVLIVWIVPHLVLMLLLTPVVLARPSWIAAEWGIRSFEAKITVEGMAQPAQPQQSGVTNRSRSELSGVFHGETAFGDSKDSSGTAWLKQTRNAVLDRKLFIAITAGIVLIAGLAASVNRTEFNPDFRPIAAVLRSNYWLTIHVIAIMVSYAAAFVAWGMATVSLGYVVFGRYQRSASELEGQTASIRLPEMCQLFSPVIERLLRIALLLLIVGTVLGARWADYSWGRFWSWDPKEVWALITILFYVIVFHGRIARYYGTVGITVGALFASITVIITWYGINFVFKGSVHAYGGGTESNATIFLGAFIAANVLWGALALLRYSAEVYGNEAAE